jgi:hypothetical protein
VTAMAMLTLWDGGTLWTRGVRGDGLVDCEVRDADGDQVTTTICYIHADGTVMVPADCQGLPDEYNLDGRCVGRWVEATTGSPCMDMGDGVPRLAPGSPDPIGRV